MPAFAPFHTPPPPPPPTPPGLHSGRVSRGARWCHPAAPVGRRVSSAAEADVTFIPRPRSCSTSRTCDRLNPYSSGRAKQPRARRQGAAGIACVAGISRIITLLRLIMSLGPLSFLVRPIVLNELPENQTDDSTQIKRQNGAPVAAVDPGSAVTNAVDISGELRARIQDMYVDYVAEDGVDYNALVQSGAFAQYKHSVSKLRDYDISQLKSDDMRVAFFVNLYNALTIHSFAVLGPPAENSLSRLFFNSQVSYNIAGTTYSLTDMENGILRANRGVSLWPRPFGAGDVRLGAMVTSLDPRIHFVLNCGAASCPPIRFLIPERLDEQLSLATRAFLRSSKNFKVEQSDVSSSQTEDINSSSFKSTQPLTVTLSAIFRWYKADFASDGSDLSILQYVVAHAGLENDQARTLADALDRPDAEDISIKYAPYDWSLNSYKATKRAPEIIS